MVRQAHHDLVLIFQRSFVINMMPNDVVLSPPPITTDQQLSKQRYFTSNNCIEEAVGLNKGLYRFVLYLTTAYVTNIFSLTNHIVNEHFFLIKYHLLGLVCDQ